MLQSNPNVIEWLRFVYRNTEAENQLDSTRLYRSLYQNRLNILIMVKNMYQFNGLKEAREWCDNNIFND